MREKEHIVNVFIFLFIVQVTELMHKMEDEKRMTRDLSFASSEFQVCNILTYNTVTFTDDVVCVIQLSFPSRIENFQMLI